MSKKVVTIQDISCYGQCSITVALPILSAYGIEAAILPSAILSTHTGGFKGFSVHDLTEEMPRIIKHWINEKISFDAVYTGYIGDARQFDYVLECKEKLLNKNGIFIVDPAMADHGKLYTGLDQAIVDGMKRICSAADYVLPNITEACLLTNTEYKEVYDEEYIKLLLHRVKALGCKNVILTGVCKDNLLGASFYNGDELITIYQEKQAASYHGTGDIFSSVIVANILNDVSMKDNLENATEFIVKCIQSTMDDPNHRYGVKFEDVLKKRK